MQIDVFLNEDRNVDVTETQTYSFDGEFNGITRSLIPKEETEIVYVKVTENGKKLKVEQDENDYRIYRDGEDEQVTIKLIYTIKNGVELYSDVKKLNGIIDSRKG